VNRCHSLTITVVGNRVTTTVNGVKADEYDDRRSGFRSGAIALFVNGVSACQFQAVEIQELPGKGKGTYILFVQLSCISDRLFYEKDVCPLFRSPVPAAAGPGNGDGARKRGRD
jgi:hypothetical protein